MSHKQALIKGVYYVEVSGSDGVKFFWEIIEDHDFEETNCNGDIELRGVGFNCFYEYGGGCKSLTVLLICYF